MDRLGPGFERFERVGGRTGERKCDAMQCNLGPLYVSPFPGLELGGFYLAGSRSSSKLAGEGNLGKTRRSRRQGAGCSALVLATQPSQVRQVWVW